MRYVLFALFASALAPQAAAQPSFDCARATTAVEREICKDPELSKLDREMADLFTKVSGKLDAVPRDHLLKDQIRWNHHRAACQGGLVDCIKGTYNQRIAWLKFLDGAPYPFVSQQWIVRSGKKKVARYEIVATYPQFDAPGVDFAAINREFAADARRGADESMPDDGEDRPDMTYTYEQGFALHRPPGERTLSVEVSFSSFTGGAHGYGGTYGVSIDQRTGRKLALADIFAADKPWLNEVTSLVIADLKEQFVRQQRADDQDLKLEPMSKMLGEQRRWLFMAEHLQIIFNPYDVGPYAAGAYYVDIPYGKIRALFRANGPIAIP